MWKINQVSSTKINCSWKNIETYECYVLDELHSLPWRGKVVNLNIENAHLLFPLPAVFLSIDLVLATGNTFLVWFSFIILYLVLHTVFWCLRDHTMHTKISKHNCHVLLGVYRFLYLLKLWISYLTEIQMFPYVSCLTMTLCITLNSSSLSIICVLSICRQIAQWFCKLHFRSCSFTTSWFYTLHWILHFHGQISDSYHLIVSRQIYRKLRIILLQAFF